MEVFVYLRTGGQRESMVVRLLSDGEDLRRSLERFDAGHARCFLDADRQKVCAHAPELVALIDGATPRNQHHARLLRRIAR